MKWGNLIFCWTLLGLLSVAVESNAFQEDPKPAALAPHHVIRLKLPERYSQPKFEAQVISDDSQLLAIACENSQIALIKIANGDIVARIPAEVGYVIDLEFSRDGSRLHVIGTSAQKLFDIKLGKELSMSRDQQLGDLGIVLTNRNGKWTIQSFKANVSAEASSFPQVGDEITAIGEGKSGDMVSIMGMEREQALAMLTGPVDTVVQLEFIPAGELKKQVVLVHRRADTNDGSQPSPKSSSSPFEENMVCCLSDHFHTFSNAATGQIVRAFMPEDIHQRTGTPALSRDGQLYAFLGKLVGTEEFAIEVFEIKSGKRVARIDNVRSYLPEGGGMMTRSYFYGMKFSPDNSRIYVGAWDRICVYSVATKSYESSFNLHRNVPDSERITPTPNKKDGSLMEIALAENAGGIDIRQATGDLQVNSFGVSRLGLLATGTYGGAMSLWNMTQGRYLHSFENLPQETIEHIEFSPNGEWLSFYVGGELHLVDLRSVLAPEEKQ